MSSACTEGEAVSQTGWRRPNCLATQPVGEKKRGIGCFTAFVRFYCDCLIPERLFGFPVFVWADRRNLRMGLGSYLHAG